MFNKKILKLDIDITLLYLIENHLTRHKTLTARDYLGLKTQLKAIDTMDILIK